MHIYKRWIMNKNLKFLASVLLLLTLTTLMVSSFNLAKVEGAEPTLEEVLKGLGFTNLTRVDLQTFPPGTYEVTLYAEHAGYRDYNELSWYPIGTDDFYLIFKGSDKPVINKTFTAESEFGLFFNVTHKGHKYYSEINKNFDGKWHHRVYQNLDDPSMYLIGWENLPASHSDWDYQDMVISLKKIGGSSPLRNPAGPVGGTLLPVNKLKVALVLVEVNAPFMLASAASILFVASAVEKLRKRRKKG